MNRIASFTVDHTKIMPGIYLSRVDGDVTTYDLRMRKPNTGDVMSNSVLHSVEHLFATFVRNSEIGDDVIYFGPMGCQTGFYLLIRNAGHERVLAVIKKILDDIIHYDGEMPGASEIECGNYRNLSTSAAQEECRRYLERVRGWTAEKLQYPN